MFQEIDKQYIKPYKDADNKKWFRDADTEIDLFIWQNVNSEISRLQFWLRESLVEWDIETGMKTGRVQEENGAFVHYQSELYKLHHEWDKNLVSLVTNLIQKKTNPEDETLAEIKNILLEISGKFSG